METILIVEDEPIIAAQIAMHLSNNHYQVAGIAYDVEAAKQQLARATPDAVLIDIRLDGKEDGIDLAIFIKNNYTIPLLFLTSHTDKATISRAKEAEPAAYLVKPFDEKALLASIEITLSNFTKQQHKQVPVLSFSKINKHLLDQLSEREFEVLKLIYEGKTNQQAAAEINISINTIKKHTISAYQKLNVTSRTGAIARLLELTVL